MKKETLTSAADHEMIGAKAKKKKSKKAVKVLIWVFSVLAVLVLAVFLFIKFYPGIADISISAEDRADYAKRAANFDGKEFSNEHEFHMMESVPDGADDGVVSTKGTTPEDVIPTSKPDFDPAGGIEELSFTWFGHSSLMIRMHGMNILFDPVFSEYASPVSFIGNKRFSELPMELEDLPEIDVLIITHDHYDHLDYQTIKSIDGKVKQYVVPLGVEYRLMRFGVSREKITNMAWWEELDINGLTVACTPARHYTGRYMIDAGKTLWTSFVLKDEYHQVFESGDTGYDTHFEDIHNKYGDFDLVFMDGAQYSLRWPSVHMNPEETGKAVRTLGANYVVPIHWGTFRLAGHPWDDSVVRLILAMDGSNVSVITPQIGETVTLEEID